MKLISSAKTPFHVKVRFHKVEDSPTLHVVDSPTLHVVDSPTLHLAEVKVERYSGLYHK